MIPKPQAYALLADAMDFHKPVPKGTVVYDFQGYDWGCVKDDWRMGNKVTRAMTHDPEGLKGPFFTVPVADLQPLSCTV